MSSLLVFVLGAAAGVIGLTAFVLIFVRLAVRLDVKPTDIDRAEARRMLDDLVETGVLARFGGSYRVTQDLPDFDRTRPGRCSKPPERG